MSASRYNFRMTEAQLAGKAAMRKKLASLRFSEKRFSKSSATAASQLHHGRRKKTARR